MAAHSDIRWRQRLQSFERALALLEEAMAGGAEALNTLEKEGAAQRFEVCLELAWKTLKDYLEYGGLVIVPVSPRQVIKEAISAGVIEDGQVWIDMLDHRNLLAHTYDAVTFDAVIEAITMKYLPSAQSLRAFLRGV